MRDPESSGAAEAAEPGDQPLRHPLDRLTAGGWVAGLARLAAGAALLTILVVVVGTDVLAPLLRFENAGLLLGGAVLVFAERFVRILKWHAILQGLPLVPRNWTFLLRLQLVGLLANLAIPSSEPLKVWAVCRTRRDIVLASETLVLDIAALSAAVGLGALIVAAALALAAAAPGWLPLPGAMLLALSAGVVAAIRWRPRRDPNAVPRLPPRAWALSAAEAGCVYGIHFAAMTAAGVPMGWAWAAAILPLLYLGQLVMLTPSGLGVREALFALIFSGISASPGKTGVAVGVCVSAMYLAVAVAGGAAALAWPGDTRGK
ncbi:MAG: flippase-like domain-containing protein [Deltaproteobacteria bacterium]|nr:flippase-like domain-containing protein [Deltaproteobacteria bacterium]